MVPPLPSASSSLSHLTLAVHPDDRGPYQEVGSVGAEMGTSPQSTQASRTWWFGWGMDLRKRLAACVQSPTSTRHFLTNTLKSALM